jgi:hypothetical protein
VGFHAAFGVCVRGVVRVVVRVVFVVVRARVLADLPTVLVVREPVELLRRCDLVAPVLVVRRRVVRDVLLVRVLVFDCVRFLGLCNAGIVGLPALRMSPVRLLSFLGSLV